MRLPPLIKQVDEKLRGWPDKWLTIIIVALSITGLLIAFKAPPAVKAAWAAWELAP